MREGRKGERENWKRRINFNRMEERSRRDKAGINEENEENGRGE